MRAVVFADADLERAAATAPMAAFDNSGQDCCSRSRVLVQRSAFERFMELLEPAVKSLAVGDPADPATAMGPLISTRHLAKVTATCRSTRTPRCGTGRPSRVQAVRTGPGTRPGRRRVITETKNVFIATEE